MCVSFFLYNNRVTSNKKGEKEELFQQYFAKENQRVLVKGMTGELMLLLTSDVNYQKYNPHVVATPAAHCPPRRHCTPTHF